MSIGAGDRVLPGAGPRFRLYGRMLVLAAAVLIADQLSKHWAVSALSDGRRMAVISDVIQLRLVYNPGAAFSIGTGATWVFTIAAAAGVATVLFIGRRLGSRPWTAGLGVVLGGATSHLLDRLFRAPGFARGHVVDFIDYNGFFVGNVADIALTGGAALLMVLVLRDIPLSGIEPASATDSQPASDADSEPASEPG